MHVRRKIIKGRVQQFGCRNNQIPRRNGLKVRHSTSFDDVVCRLTVTDTRAMGLRKFKDTRNSDLADGGDEIAHTLDEIRRVTSDAEFTTLIRALNIVACAFRLLTIHELSEALTIDVS